MNIETGGMSAEWKHVLDAAMRLPEREREILADQLNASLGTFGRDAEWEAAWSDELDRRDAELDSGNVQPLTLKDVQKLMREARDGNACS